MKIPRLAVALSSAAIVLAFVACSSSSNDNNAGGASPTSCQGPPAATGPGSDACSACAQISCGSQLSSVGSSCGAYVTCYSGCQCSDFTCIQGCLNRIDDTCRSAYGPLAICLSQSCPSPCAPPADGGAGG